MRASDLLHDERDALGLGVHGRDRPAVDRPAEHLAKQQAALRRGEPRHREPADEAHPLHVRDEVHGLGNVGELVGAEVQEQEDRPLGDAADGVAEHPDRVVVGPLRVVDEQRDRLQVGQLLDRDAGKVEGPQQLRRPARATRSPARLAR